MAFLIGSRTIVRWLALAVMGSVLSDCAWGQHYELPPPRQQTLGLPVFENTSGQAPAQKPPALVPRQTHRAANDEQLELVTERYENRAVKIQRHVKLDHDRNYVNHGPWTYFDPQGKVLAQGQYHEGKQQGKWVLQTSRIAIRSEGFQPPFTSQASFLDGELHGTWTMSDARQRIIATYVFDRGKIHGQITTFYPSSQQRTQTTFVEGKLHGEAMLWQADGRLARREYYRGGKQLVPHVEKYDMRNKKSAGWILRSSIEFVANINWWHSLVEIRQEQAAGQDEKIGEWRQWHPNGNLQYVGSFQNNKPYGRHVWWYATGQKRASGQYDGGAADGLWTQWYPNGMKNEEGTYLAGQRQGDWLAWDQQGKLIESTDDWEIDRLADSPSVDVRTEFVEVPVESQSEPTYPVGAFPTN